MFHWVPPSTEVLIDDRGVPSRLPSCLSSHFQAAHPLLYLPPDGIVAISGCQPLSFMPWVLRV